MRLGGAGLELGILVGIVLSLALGRARASLLFAGTSYYLCVTLITLVACRSAAFVHRVGVRAGGGRCACRA